MRKLLTLMLTVIFCFTVVVPGFAAGLNPQTAPEKLAVVEKYLYGTEQAGALIPRTNSLEMDVYGAQTSDPILTRIDNVYVYIFGTPGTATASFATKLNIVEWQLLQKMSDKPARTRLDEVETMLNGKVATTSAATRLDELMRLAFPSATLSTEAVVLPKDTLLKIEFTEALKSKENRAGDTVHFQMADNLYVGEVLVLPKGATGYGTVKKIVQAGSFGRDARIDIEFTNILAVDGTAIPVIMGELAKQQAETAAGAAGASIGGMILLGPVGAIGGAFVTGKSVTIPVGTVTFVQTNADVNINGIVHEGGSSAGHQP
ncbi:MAG: hypothetical protein RSF75_05335, partial [Acidaminococcaceae bacterium]